MKAIGVDLGGHGVKAGVVTYGRDGIEHFQEIQYDLVRQNRAINKRDVPKAPRIEAVTRAISILLLAQPDVQAIGVASTGIINPIKGVVEDDQAEDYIGTNWLDELLQRFGSKYRYCVENDAKAAAWGEYSIWPMRQEGNGKTPSSLVHIIIGSGIGAGIVLNGRILAGAHFVAGEFGSLPYTGRSRDQGRGKIEAFSASPGLLRASGEESLPDLIKAYKAGKGLAVTAVEEGSDALACGISALINVLGPEVAVMGGGVSELFPEYVQAIIKKTEELAEGKAFEGVTFAASRLRNNAGIVGIAHLAMGGAH